MENNSIEKGLLLVKKEEMQLQVQLHFLSSPLSSLSLPLLPSVLPLGLLLVQWLSLWKMLIFLLHNATIADSFGRKMTLWIAEIFCISGWLAIALAKNISWLDFGRFFVGIGVGLLSYVVPVYIAEITTKDVRGTFAFSNPLLQNCGLAVAYYLGNFMSWRTLALIGILPCLIQLFGLFFVPESPRWLAKECRDEECVAVLQKLRGDEADIIKESREIMVSVGACENLSMRSLFKKKYTRQLTVTPLTIGIGLMILQQFSGIAGIASYAGSIFDLSGFSSPIGMTVLSIVVVPKSILGLILVERWGRRPLLMASAFGLGLGCISIALAFGLKNINGIVNFTPIMAFIGILTFTMMYAAGVGALPWIIMSEIFPMNMKVVAGSLVSITNWFACWIMSYCFNFMFLWSQTGTFIIFAIINGVTIVFAWCLVPETRGLTLEDIQLRWS